MLKQYAISLSNFLKTTSLEGGVVGFIPYRGIVYTQKPVLLQNVVRQVSVFILFVSFTAFVSSFEHLIFYHELSIIN